MYTALNAWLAGQPGNVNLVPITFNGIEAVLGFGLPPTARRRSQWWENNPFGHSQALAWLNAGFVTEQVDVLNETLAFRRAD